MPLPSPESSESLRPEAGDQQEWITAVGSFTEDLTARGYSEFTVRDYRSDVLRMAGYLGVGPWDVKASHAALLDRCMLADGLCLAARRRRLSAWSRFIQYQRSRGPVRRLGPRMLRAALESGPLDHLLVGLVYLGCLRLTEIADLEGRDVRLRKRVLKTRSGWRLVPLHPRLVEIIRGLRYHTSVTAYRPLLPGLRGYPMNARTLHGRFQRLAQRSGLREVRPDALRRETSQHLVSTGTPGGLVQALLGQDRGRLVAPRRGRLVDLSCLRKRLEDLPV